MAGRFEYRYLNAMCHDRSMSSTIMIMYICRIISLCCTLLCMVKALTLLTGWLKHLTLMFIRGRRWCSELEQFTSLHGATYCGYLCIVGEITELMNADVLVQVFVCVALPNVHVYTLSFVQYLIICVGTFECSSPCCPWWPAGGCQVPHAQIWRKQVWHGQPCSKLSPQGSMGGSPQSGAVSHWGGRIWPQSQGQGEEV